MLIKDFKWGFEDIKKCPWCNKKLRLHFSMGESGEKEIGAAGYTQTIGVVAPPEIKEEKCLQVFGKSIGEYDKKGLIEIIEIISKYQIMTAEIIGAEIESKMNKEIRGVK